MALITLGLCIIFQETLLKNVELAGTSCARAPKLFRELRISPDVLKTLLLQFPGTLLLPLSSASLGIFFASLRLTLSPEKIDLCLYAADHN